MRHAEMLGHVQAGALHRLVHLSIGRGARHDQVALGAERLQAHAGVRCGMGLAEQRGIALPEQHALHHARPMSSNAPMARSTRPASISRASSAPLHAHRIDARLRLTWARTSIRRGMKWISPTSVMATRKRRMLAAGSRRLILQGPGQQRQRLAHRPCQLRARRGLHALGGAHEQLVAERLPQAAQGIADGGLGQVQPARDGRDVAVLQQMLEQQQQIQVHVAQAGHHAPTIHKIYSLYFTFRSLMGRFFRKWRIDHDSPDRAAMHRAPPPGGFHGTAIPDRLWQRLRHRGAARRPAAKAATRRSSAPTACTPNSCPAPPSPRRAPEPPFLAIPDPPGAQHKPFERHDGAAGWLSTFGEGPVTPNQLRWSPCRSRPRPPTSSTA